ncbi:MAG: fasciclin domain-containing protein [Planctomycetes bacterium]|nr:fasciclin domain-containing protein [Planctomycetota bacterium]
MNRLLSTPSFLLAALLTCSPIASGADSNLEFEGGTQGWQTVLDGVMGGLSTGRIEAGDGGTLRFSGELSLENNGGFSQIRTSVPEGTFDGASGLVLRVKGDGRNYQCDIRSSRLRLMAGGYQRVLATKAGEWTEIEIPFSECVANSFGQRVRNAPSLDPASIESVGITLADKKEGPFAIEVDWIRPAGKAATPASPNSLAAVATKANLTTLLALVKASGIELPAGTKLTIFAPTNEAFAKLPKDQVEFLTSAKGKSTLQAILKHHVVGQSVGSSAVLERRRLAALSGQSLDIDPAALTVDGARLVATDVAFDGGLVHVIDTVMLPELRSIEQIVAEDERFTTLRAAIEAAGIGSQLGSRNPGPWTLLAPSNQAFGAIPADALKELLQDQPALTAVLVAHVLPTAIRREDMLAQGSARTLMGDGSVAFALESGAITVAGARIEVADIEAANGVIHIIDRVLPAQPTTAATMAPSPKQRSRQAAAILELAIERGVPRFNAGDQASCAALYELAITSVVLLGADAIGDGNAADLAAALKRGAEHEDAAERAWVYRRAMDQVLGRMVALMQPAE